MKKKMVSFSLDLENPPALTQDEQNRLDALGSRPDSEIDFSDIPRLTPEFFKEAVRGKFYKPTKTSTTVRIDSDVLAWLRTQGKGYQSRINAILRKEMIKEMLAAMKQARLAGSATASSGATQPR